MSVFTMVNAAQERGTVTWGNTIFKYIPPEYDNPPIFEPFEFETSDVPSFANFVSEFWYLPLHASGIYLIAIFVIQHYMRDRKPLDLTAPLFLWNLGLGIFSIFGLFRTLPELFYLLSRPNGFWTTICER